PISSWYSRIVMRAYEDPSRSRTVSRREHAKPAPEAQRFFRSSEKPLPSGMTSPLHWDGRRISPPRVAVTALPVRIFLPGTVRPDPRRTAARTRALIQPQRCTPSHSRSGLRPARRDCRAAPSRKVPVTEQTSAAPTFLELGVPTAIANALEKNGKTTAFPIQRDTLSDTLAGRDVLGRGRTGSGKTIAFGIPLVANLASDPADAAKRRRPSRPRGIVLAPTRELVTQIAETIKVLADPVGVKVTTIFGG